jgi:ketosteroid isomerase-like protein
MRNKIIVLSAIVLLVGSLTVSPQMPVKTSDDVLQVLKKYDAAWNKKDVEGVAQILAPDYVYFNSLGGTSTRQQTLDFLGSPDYKLTSVERSEIKSHRTGNTVVVSSRWIGKGSWRNGEINDDQRCGLVFVKIGNGWKLITEHCTQIVAK